MCSSIHLSVPKFFQAVNHRFLWIRRTARGGGTSFGPFQPTNPPTDRPNVMAHPPKCPPNPPAPRILPDYSLRFGAERNHRMLLHALPQPRRRRLSRRRTDISS
ncbi:hypothetical protein PAHAL_1G454400 [Panicum hallii]|uniref:Uncharacterized protein n=1 Tax=Panicum hallii TaxID=206008 RepID=A0A2T8KYF9_9POAL|nr:hypothetical protein PAHAL_1G454400 [Panicum hallii]